MILQLLLALLLPSSSGALSLFMRTTWLAEVPEPVWRSWFELIARGRREGPASPFYVAELGLQNTACCENGPDSRGCLGAKCSDLGLQPKDEVVIDEGYSIDIVVNSAGVTVAIEVDGPSHFVGRTPTGATLLKRRQLRSFGWSLLSLPYWDWDLWNAPGNNDGGGGP